MIRSRWLIAGPVLLPVAAHAQQTQTAPAATPTPATPGAIPVPAAPVGLPTPVPSATPTPTASPSPVATPTPTPRQVAPATPRVSRSPVPTQVATPTPVATATPATTQTPAVVAPPGPMPVAIPTATPTPEPLPTASPVAQAATASGNNATWWIVVLVAALAAVVGVLLRRRRRRRRSEEAVEALPSPADVPPRSAPPVPAPAPISSVEDPVAVLASSPVAEPALDTASVAPAQLAIDFRPVRAGVNLLSATVESEVVVTNTGPTPVADVRVEIRMIGAHSGQDADLAAIAAEPVARPAVAPFALPPGQFVQLSAVAALPRASIVPLDAGGRPIFVPIVTVKIEGVAGGAPIRHTAAFAIGVERVDSARLAPFRLDGPPRTFDTVAARPHPVG